MKPKYAISLAFVLCLFAFSSDVKAAPILRDDIVAIVNDVLDGYRSVVDVEFEVLRTRILELEGANQELKDANKELADELLEVVDLIDEIREEVTQRSSE
ncbi:MAG: hypothetical protein ACPGXY_06655 [Alphaproteobacteria bacterium]